jgi:NAD(P)-dependent dehydrogenase (short-subunit alcohol dehydrogenase family)
VLRVNAILPGVIRTPIVASVLETREQELAAGLPLERIGEPTDIAAAAASWPATKRVGSAVPTSPSMAATP